MTATKIQKRFMMMWLTWLRFMLKLIKTLVLLFAMRSKHLDEDPGASKFFKSPYQKDVQDPGASKFFKSPYQKDVQAFYGEMGTNQTNVILPYKMKIAWDLNREIDQFVCHEKVAKPMQVIFEEILDYYGIEQIEKLGLNLFGGCFNVRMMTGGTQYSMHSWGIAVDLDPTRNEYNWNDTQANFAKPEYKAYWDIVEKNGAISIGRKCNFDWMHWQFARL